LQCDFSVTAVLFIFLCFVEWDFFCGLCFLYKNSRFGSAKN